VSGVQTTARRAGWIAHHAPATATDPKAGVAVLVKADSKRVARVSGSAPQGGLCGRLLGVEITIDDERTYIYSIYLPARPDKRLDTLLKIEQQGLIKHNSIVGGDFNCVDHVRRDALSAQGTYANTHRRKCREAAAKRGLTDIYPFLTNDAPGGFTRLSSTVRTRIYRIYGPTENTSWRRIAAAAEVTLFTGTIASDHLPVVVAVESLSARPPTQAEAKIKPSTLQLPNVQAAEHHIWTSVYKRYPVEDYGQAAVWTLAKQTVATFPLDFQKQSNQGTHPVQEIKNLMKIAYTEADTQTPSHARIEHIKSLE
jgi:endonuclease/exonuclease/phosphatase family metal-dependent hydrolase